MHCRAAAALASAALAATGCEQILGIHDLTERPPADVDLVIEPGGTQDFGELTMGTISGPVVVTIRNRGIAASSTVTVGLEGDDTDAFVLAADGCNRVLAPDDSCVAELRFRPTRSASQVASLRAADESGADTQISLLGLGRVPLVTLPGELAFGNISVGNTSVAAEIQVINTGSTATEELTVGLVSAIQFEIVAGQNGCQDQVLDPGASCSLEVVFHPTEAGDQTTDLLVSAVPFGTISMPLSGNGVADIGVAIDPDTHDFGPRAIQTSTAQFGFSVTNTSGAAIGPLTTQISNSAFIKTNGCDISSLANNASCTILVNFLPTQAGEAVASLTVFNGSSPATAASLSGTGTANLSVSRDGAGSGTVRSAPAGIDCGSECVADFDVSQVTLTATEDNGSTFTGWSGGGCSGANTSCVVPMDQAHIVTATFDTTVTTLTVQAIGNGDGVVTSPTHTAISCSTAGIGGDEICSVQVTPGTDVTLEATAQSGSDFVGWCGVCIDAGLNPTCQITVNSSVNVQAYFCPQVGPPCAVGC